MAIPVKQLAGEKPAGSLARASRGSRQHSAMILAESSGWLTTEQVSQILQVPVGTLRQWRHFKKHLEYVKLGRVVRYDPRTIQAFLRSHRVRVDS